MTQLFIYIAGFIFTVLAMGYLSKDKETGKIEWSGRDGDTDPVLTIMLSGLMWPFLAPLAALAGTIWLLYTLTQKFLQFVIED